MLLYHNFSFCVRISFQHTQSCQQSLFVHAPKQSFQTSGSLSFCIYPSFYTICIYSRIAQFAFSLFLRETIFFIICFFYLFHPHFIPINVYFVFFTLVWRKLLFLVWRFYSIKGHLYNNKRRNGPYNHTIDSFAQKSVSFSQRFPTTVPPLSVFLLQKKFFSRKKSPALLFIIYKGFCFSNKRSSFRTKSRFSFCSSLPFETHRIYSHLLQTKFLSRKKSLKSLGVLFIPFSPSSP